MKTLGDWHTARVPWDDFAKVGDLVDESIYWYFLEVVPPARMGGGLLQVGEPSRHINGRPTFSTFIKVRNEVWQWRGDCFLNETTMPTEKETT